LRCSVTSEEAVAHPLPQKADPKEPS